jgi:signal transduction histidine kinase/CheY-like chemotaxis protein
VEALLSSRGGRASEEDLGVEELRIGMVRHLAVGTMVCGFLALILLYDGERIATWLPPIILSVVGYLAWQLARINGVVLAGFLLIALWLILTGCILLYPGLPLVLIYCLVILPAAFMFSPWAATFGGLASAIASAVIHAGWPGLEPDSTYALALFMISVTTLLAWVLASPLTTTLGWAWVAYEQAEVKMTEARIRQGELGRVTKSLNETLTTLEDLNRQLAEARIVAEEARRLKAEFAAAVSHELRTPLNLIIGFAEMLVFPHRNPARSLPDVNRKHLQAIYRNACHLSNLVDDILDLSQIDAQRLALHKETIRVADVVAEAVAVVRDLIEDEGLALAVEVSTDLPEVNADPTRVRQILINLLGNASRFTDDGGITICGRPDGNGVVISVADTGMGIPAADIPHVFEEFRQFGERRRGGSGLGLSICKRLVELHGGSMWVESAPGRGSTFSLSLPFAQTVAGIPSSPSLERQLATLAGQSSLPTLAVVDRDGTSKIFRRYLDHYRILAVDSVERARKMLAAGRASALLFTSASDVEVWREVQREDPSLHPVAFCPLRATGQARRDLGVAAFLVKPVTPSQLSAALRRVAKRWRSVGIVEDHPEMAGLLIDMVQSIRPTGLVWQASDGREAVAKLLNQRPDVLLLDLLMPHLNGYELLHEMRRDERLRSVAVIVISGAEERDERVVAEMVGVTRPGGMTIGEAMACLKRGLDSLLIQPDSSDREL